MQRDDFFAPNGINYENISALSKEQALIFEKRICEFSEIANDAAVLSAELFDSGFGIYEILGFISDGFSFDFSISDGITLQKNVSMIRNCISAIDARDKAVFSVLFAEMIKKLGVSLSESDFLMSGEGDSSVVYVKNRLSDEAYDVFSVGISDATVSYAESLKDAAESVSDGRKEFAILPGSPAGDRWTYGTGPIRRLLFCSALSLCGNRLRPGPDSKRNTPDFHADDDRYLELRLRADGALSLSDLFSASEMLGASVYRINTVSFQSEDGEIPYYTIVFKDEGQDFSNLLVFLTLFAGSYTAVGIYKNLE